MTDGAAWLEEEAKSAARNLTRRHLERLLALGCRKAAQLGINHVPFGVMDITVDRDKLYEPSGDSSGKGALIVPVCWPVIDLVALYLDDPKTWYWRTGAAWALGSHLLEHWQGEPVPMVSTPLDWLRAGGEAACVLDWSARSPAWPLLRNARMIEVDDRELGKRLLDSITRSVPRPKISRIRRPEGTSV